MRYFKNENSKEDYDLQVDNTIESGDILTGEVVNGGWFLHYNKQTHEFRACRGSSSIDTPENKGVSRLVEVFKNEDGSFA